MADMKPQHAAALALCGWYLLAPPALPSPLRPHSAAPLSTWGLVESFDSAEACQRALSKKWDDEEERFQSEYPHPSEFEKFALAERAQSECIATDDPRLKEK
jgi:hypothetical protein